MNTVRVGDKEYVVGFPEPASYQGEAPQGAPSQESSPGVFQGMSKAPSHAIESLAGSWNALGAELGAKYGDEELTKYSERKLSNNIKNKQELEKDMGVGAHLLSGGIQSITTVAPMVLGGPASIGARMALTAGASYGQNVGNVLMEQEQTGYGRNFEEAKSAGAKMAVADTALSMIPTAAVKSAMGRVGADAAVGAASGAQQTSFTNLATGRDWDEGIGMGAAFGGIAGGTLSGLNQAASVNWNQAGKDAINTVRNLGVNKSLDKNFQNDYVEYVNFNRDIDDKMANLTPDSPEYDELLAARTNLGKQGLDRVGMVKAMSIFEKHGVKTGDEMLDYDLRSYDGSYSKGNAADIAGPGRSAALRAKETIKKAHSGMFARGGVEKGYTEASHLNEFQADARLAIGEAIGSMGSNVAKVRDMMRKMKDANEDYKNNRGGEPLDDETYGKLTRLKEYLDDIDNNYSGYLSNKRVADFSGLERASQEAIRLADQLGLRPQLKGVDGVLGTFDPIEGLSTIDNMYAMARSKMHNFDMGKFDPLQESVRGGFKASDAAMTFGTGGAWLAAKMARGAIRPLEARYSQRALRKQIEKGSSLSGMEKALNEKAAAARQAANLATAKAKVSGSEADKAEADKAKAAAEEAKVEAEVASKEIKDAETAVKQAEADKVSEQLREDIATGGGEKAAETAVDKMEDMGYHVPEERPSVFESETSLAGAAKRPSPVSDTSKAEKDAQAAREQAEKDAQAAQEAQARAEQVRAMARQRQAGTASSEDSPEVVRAQQEADLAAQEAELSAAHAAMLEEKNRANRDLVSQQSSIERAKAEKAAEDARLDEYARAAEADMQRMLEEGLFREAEANRDVLASTPKTPEKKSSEVETSDKPEDWSEADEKEFLESLNMVDEMSQPKVEETAEAATEVPEPKAEPKPKPSPTEFAKSRKSDREKLNRLDKLTTAELRKTPEAVKERSYLRKKDNLLTKAYDDFTLKFGHKHRREDIDQVFNEFTDEEIFNNRIKSSEVNAKLRQLYERQRREVVDFGDELPKVKPAEQEAPKTREEIEQERIESEWEAVDKLAEQYGISKEAIEEATRKLGTSRDRKVKAESVIREALREKKAAPIPKAAPSTYAPDEASKKLQELGKDLLTKGEITEVFNRKLSGFKGPITESKVQSAIEALYAAIDTKKQAAINKAKDDLKDLENLDKARLTAEHRARVERLIKEKTEEIARIGDEKNEILRKAREAEAKRKADEAKRKSDDADARAAAAEQKRIYDAQAELDAIERQKKAALDYLKRKKVNNFKIAMFERDFLNNHTKPFPNDIQAVKMAERWMNGVVESDSKKLSQDLDNKVAQVEENLRKALEKRPVQNINILFEGIVDGKFGGKDKSPSGSLDRIAEQLGSFKAVEGRLSGEAKALNDALIAAYEFAMKAKKDHPDNPEMWLSWELYDATRDALIGASNSGTYHGRVGIGIRNDIFGNTGKRTWFSDADIKKMEEEIAAAEDTGVDLEDPDITIR